ncbi:hypothetical protein OIU79_011455 [Salix purpurea]|uniref:Uncharacterized protein n=1 Tax=Salix purpurea TaxID=77065 RepID=A0A9Q0Q0W3_SALPP|nr:hypothetical protein OIU79_011455 [Salix purpurea]
MDRASALKEYQCIRLPVTSKKVLHPPPVDRRSRGFALPGHRLFDPMTASAEESEELQTETHAFLRQCSFCQLIDVVLLVIRRTPLSAGRKLLGSHALFISLFISSELRV